MTKKERRRIVIKRLAKERCVSLSVAAHIYNCWSRKQQKAARDAAAGQMPLYKTE